MTTGAEELSNRIRAEFDASARRKADSEAAREEESRRRADRLAQFDRVCEEMKSVWGPRFEAFAKQFGDRLQITPRLEPGKREAAILFQTPMANMTLTLTASPNADVSSLVLNYDLLVVPAYFEYERYSRMETPLASPDRDAVGRWIDDCLVSCVRVYLTMRENEFHVRRAMVEDPITGKRMLPEEAGASLTAHGTTRYFESEASLQRYKDKMQIR